MLGWTRGSEQSQPGDHHDDDQCLSINNTADPLMGLPVYPDHRRGQARIDQARIDHSFSTLQPIHDADAAVTGLPVPRQGSSHHVPQMAHPRPQYSIPPIFYAAWSTPQSPHPPPAATHAEDCHDGVSTHQLENATLPGPVPIELFDNAPPSQSGVALGSPSFYYLDDITPFKKVNRRRDIPSKANRPVFKNAKRVGMERAQLVREMNSGTSSANIQSSSESDVKIVPGLGTRRLMEDLRDRMRRTMFDRALLPPKGSLSATVDSSWQTAANTFNGTDHEWAIQTMNDKTYIDNKMGSVIDDVSEEMLAVAQVFTYQQYGLDFDMPVLLQQSDIVKRADYVQGLLNNDLFIFGQLLSVNGVQIGSALIAFANTAIIRIVRYVLYDSPLQYHRYISNGNYGPLVSMTATVCMWALQQYETGRFVERKFVPEEATHTNTEFLRVFDNMAPVDVAALTAQLTSNSIMAQASLVTTA
ncbi:hypothetical protein DEU56DRAFT_918499 [Suillus clintonianus]|uniref:uncharacterized protein n=1 Tax=Suillus clintonianus TaxID=1904413 RepID=UPI001B88462E|nr:uncharacterized protein DEU56DRAFT_918499 [Suillus clintonianus]KAG2120018.1 hypothetical protein DEU56DRAFT_918499 [Suillus clintonianus]